MLFMYCGCVVLFIYCELCTAVYVLRVVKCCLCNVSCIMLFMYCELCTIVFALWLCSVVYALSLCSAAYVL